MDLVIRNGLSDQTGDPIEVGIRDGVIAAVAPSGVPSGTKEIDANGRLISPALIEPHFHLENAYLWDGMVNQSGTLHEAIEIYAQVKHDLTVDDMVARAGRAVLRPARRGRRGPDGP